MGSVPLQVIIDFLESLFSLCDLAKTITTHKGSHLMSYELSTYQESKGIHHVRMEYNNLQANRGVERFNQSLKNGLNTHLAEGCTLNKALFLTLLHYRATQHSTTGVSPASVMLGRELELPLDRHSATHPLIPVPAPRVKASVTRQKLRMKQQLDQSGRARAPNIAVSDRVRVNRPHRNNKMASAANLAQPPSASLMPPGVMLDTYGRC